MIQDATSSLPIVSLTAEGEALQRAIIDACIPPGPGFFYLADHGIAAARVATAFEATKKLLSGEDETLMQQKQRSIDRPNNTGWTPLEQESLDTSSTAADLKQSFYLTRLSQVTSSNAHSPPAQQLPDVLTPYREEFSALADDCAEVCSKLHRAFALALELPEETFAAQHHGAHDRLRMIHYPKAPHLGPSLRAGAHTDYGTCTLLFQREVGGLQVKLDALGTDEPVWLDVQPREGCLVVNIGDALEFWTGGLLKSTLHRVALPGQNDGRDRYSLAYFSQPDEETLLVPMKLAPHLEARRVVKEEWDRTLLSKGVQPGTAALTGGEHLRARLNASYK